MLIQYMSDLHLEFPENKSYISTSPLLPKGDVLVLAGDVVPFILIDKHKDFFDYLADNFEQTYWVPGNHEYYHFDAAAKVGTICEKIRNNVSLVNNWLLKIRDTHLIFSTLWSKISEQHQWDIQQNMNDFRVIKYNTQRFSIEQYNKLHQNSLNFIKGELAGGETTIKKVVVTHHVPTYVNYPEKYKGSLLSEGFVVELFDVITDMRPDFWIYGHHHSNTPDFKIGNCQMVTNQLGYVRQNEHFLFENNKTITV